VQAKGVSASRGKRIRGGAVVAGIERSKVAAVDAEGVEGVKLIARGAGEGAKSKACRKIGQL
jgi:hypothetical protein